MALFGKKSPAEDIIKKFEALSDEDKEAVKKSLFGEKAEDLEKAEDEREIDKIEEDKADDPEKADEKKEEVKEESEEIGKDVDEAKEDEKTEDVQAETEETETEEPTETVETTEGETEDNKADIEEYVKKHDEVMDGFNARLSALEEKLMSLFDTDKEDDKDYGISGEGKRNIVTEDDVRSDDIIKKLGGYAR